MPSSIIPFGGAGNVTGSKHLLETDHGSRILFDCGTFQGLPDVRERNRQLPFPPESIDAVVLSHGHLDHCGMLALLCKRGFQGRIHATKGTRDVALHIMKDSAGIEQQDAAYRAKHHIGAPDDREPLFTEKDVQRAASHFDPAPYAREQDEWIPVTNDTRVKFYEAGHILGSAVAVLEMDTDKNPVRVGYTGDIGPRNPFLLRPPEVPREQIHTLLMESTYGDRELTPPDDAVSRFADAITRIHTRGGKMIIPAFSLGRTQTIVYLLHRLSHEQKIPRFPIYVDSPLASNLTETYRSHRHYYTPSTKEEFPGDDHYPLSFHNLTYTKSVAESKKLNIKQGPYAVICSSGMMTAGRSVHHLRHSISDPNNAVIITGYQAKGTTGRRILEGAKRVELYGDTFDVRAEVLVFNEFSAHADRDDLRRYAERIKGLQQLILVHGEEHQADALRGYLLESHPEWKIHRPNEGDEIII